MNVGGVVLCGGKSSRMGQPKATLPFGPETMLARVVRLLGEVVQPIVVVAAAGQEPPPIPAGVLHACDRRPDRGPLEGIAAGLAALPADVDAAYITGCDVPLLVGDFVREMIRQLDDFDIAVPRDGELYHPLAGVYRKSVLPRIEQLLATSQLRPVYLYATCRTREVAVEKLRAVDADLATLANLNRPEDYRDALAIAGFANS